MNLSRSLIEMLAYNSVSLLYYALAMQTFLVSKFITIYLCMWSISKVSCVLIVIVTIKSFRCCCYCCYCLFNINNTILIFFLCCFYYCCNCVNWQLLLPVAGMSWYFYSPVRLFSFFFFVFCHFFKGHLKCSFNNNLLLL